VAQVLILNFDGADGATTYTEEVQGLTPSENMRSEIDTDWSQFGTGSLLQSSPSAAEECRLLYTYAPQSSAAVTLHAWVRVGSLPSPDGGFVLAVAGDGTVAGVAILQSGASMLAVSDKLGTPAFVPLSTVFLADTDYHVALVIDGRNLLVFVDGVVDYAHDLGMDDALGDLDGFQVFATDGAWRVDAIELATGEARWTAGFTPPASAPAAAAAVTFPISVTGVIEVIGLAVYHNVVNIPCAQIDVALFVPYRHADIPCGDVRVAGTQPLFGPGPMLIPAGQIEAIAYAPASVWRLPAAVAAMPRVIYTMTITGDADGTADAEIPISSFQALLRDGEPSYLACVVPDPLAYEPMVSARANGDIVISKGYEWPDGSRQMETIARADFEHLYYDIGARSASMTVVGYSTSINTSPKEWPVSGVSFRSLMATGKRRIRAEMDLFLRVGDTCVYGTGEDDAMTVGAIQYTVQAQPAMAVMEVTEA
jgi:hypothetical protein